MMDNQEIVEYVRSRKLQRIINAKYVPIATSTTDSTTEITTDTTDDQTDETTEQPTAAVITTNTGQEVEFLVMVHQ